MYTILVLYAFSTFTTANKGMCCPFKLARILASYGFSPFKDPLRSISSSFGLMRLSAEIQVSFILKCKAFKMALHLFDSPGNGNLRQEKQNTLSNERK